MLIVDAQVPIWISGTPVNIRRQLPAYTKDELLRDMDVAGVRAVHGARALRLDRLEARGLSSCGMN